MTNQEEKIRQLSVVVPVYNEAQTLEPLFARIDKVLTKEDIEYEIIVVDDHSTDETKEIIKNSARKYALTHLLKKGKKGKAYSIIEGTRIARFDHVVMIDADLQYAPEAIPQMVKLAPLHGVVIAERKTYKGTLIRRFSSKANSFIFGNILHGLRFDVQSGLKLFKTEIIDHLDLSHLSPWSIDIPLLYTARELGYTIGKVDITFERRKDGDSKINFLDAAIQIALSSIKIKLSRKKIYHLPAVTKDSMIGAGIAHKRKRFITHTTLNHRNSAYATLTLWQKIFIFFFLILTSLGFYLNSWNTAITIVAILSTIYFLDVLFNLFLVLKSLHYPPEIKLEEKDLENIKNDELPIYSILCPLYKESHVVSQFIRAIGRLNYPKSKLDVMLLLEEDDKETISEVKKMDLPSYIRVVIVPDSKPKTKPKACNYGLAHAKGDFVVIFDAEDIPDPMQLKKAYFAFQQLPEDIVCLQAKLNFYNPHQNFLTRLFTAEYSLWFDVVLTGLQSVETTIPLGGTSNHFRTNVLRKLHGWDPFNVTEDADLGTRLFKEGKKTAIFDSTTLEEANSNAINWLRQRSRWIKGYIQTYFVHMRNPLEFIKNHGLHAFFFQLVVGGKIAFMLINPFLWAATISYFTLFAIVGPTIERLYPTAIFYMGIISLVFGNFLCLYYYMIGCAKRGHFSLIKYVYIVPLYWLLVSLSAVIAVIQLIVKPHYWEKTHHGYHIGKKKIVTIWEEEISQTVSPEPVYVPIPVKGWQRLKSIAFSEIGGGGLLVATSVIGNFFNFLYNAYLGRALKVEEFGLVTLIGSFLYLSQVPLGAISKTVTYKTAYLLGQYNVSVKSFWAHIRKSALRFALIISGLWMMVTPVLSQFFNTSSLTPLLLFTPVWFIGTLWAVDSAYLSGTLRFGILALIITTEALSKFIFSYLLVEAGQSQYVYAAIPMSMALSLLFGYLSVKTSKAEAIKIEVKETFNFPKKFFLASVFTKLSVASFLTLDILLAKHFLPPVEAGQYALLSLVGKMVFFFGSLFSQFIVPFVSRQEGRGQSSQSIFYLILIATGVASTFAFTTVGLFGFITIPYLLGQKTASIIPYLPDYSLAIVYFTVSIAIVIYHQVKNHYVFPILSLVVSLVQILSIVFYHENISMIVHVMFWVSILSISLTSLTHIFFAPLYTFSQNLFDFIGLFKPLNGSFTKGNGHLRILIFNWRDTKHVWSGGAEVYIHELAKRWVSLGHTVTLFCGNDEKHKRFETIDGLKIVRRGGFYTVYIWAMLYYLFKFRGQYDVVIDSENGIPFFTPLYVGLPRFLLIHHIHQDVFRNHLHFPLNKIAMFIESRLMPICYKNAKIITVSESSKKDIQKLGITKEEEIYVVSPGIDPTLFTRLKKTSHPSLLYLGRLKPYKNIDLAINAFAEVLKTYKDAYFTIAGEGESQIKLANLVVRLGLHKNISFKGKVSQKEKANLLAQSWVLVQPSLIEGWGITVIEANISGTPVVAANVPGLRDSIVNRKTGILVPQESTNAFSKAIEELFTDEKTRRHMSKRAYDWAKTFNWERGAEKILNIVRSNYKEDYQRIYTGKVAIAE
ncbi:glycosyltransferase [Candidatus Gottesmanbacteria bacterium]|nr:glycosyltransferase [Candidatus Gottesmanbacteria bacterium]